MKTTKQAVQYWVRQSNKIQAKINKTTSQQDINKLQAEKEMAQVWISYFEKELSYTTR